MISDEIEFCGYDGEDSDFVVYVVDMCPEMPGIIRWSRDFGRSWTDNVPIIDKKAELDLGRYLIINDFEDYRFGCTAVFVCSSRSVARIIEISGRSIRLSLTASRSAECTIAHSDSFGIQSAVDEAIRSDKNVYFPSGTYRLTNSTFINRARSITLEGESAASVILDDSIAGLDGTLDMLGGVCFSVSDSDEVNIRNFTMIGNCSFADRDIAGCIKTRGVEPSKVYGFYYMRTNALQSCNVERLYVENCHARKMSAECFYAKGAPRTVENEPERYQKSLTYMRCSVEDSARNAFNNNDLSENTSVMYCRIRDVGGCAWEGSSRFVKIVGNYVRRAGPIAMGNLRSRDAEHERLGTAQHIVSDNVFEEGVCYGSAAVVVGAGASQVIIKNNTFVNFNSSGINLFGTSQYSDLPPEHIIVTGNSMDMTAIYGESKKRYGIRAEASYVTVADNQIYTRGCDPDENLTCIETSNLSVNTNIHDNTLTAAGVGISVEEPIGIVGEVIDDLHFFRYEPPFGQQGKPPIPRRLSHKFKNWIIKWGRDDFSRIESCDPETRVFTLCEPRKMTSGERFTYYPERDSLMIHDNIISDTLIDISASEK
jgi:hypothetical protein